MSIDDQARQDDDLNRYRPCVGVMVINRDGLVWMGLRSEALDQIEGRGNWWQMPQGGIDEGEDVEAAALRELFEETGIRNADVLGRTEGWLAYDLPKEYAPNAWGGRYIGQKQVWYALRFMGQDTEINIDPPPADGHKKEFADWEWVAPDDVVDLVVYFKRDVYIQVMAQLRKFAVPG